MQTSEVRGIDSRKKRKHQPLIFRHYQIWMLEVGAVVAAAVVAMDLALKTTQNTTVNKHVQ